MTLPPLDNRGLLPEGIHEADRQEIENVFCVSLYRQKLFEELIRFFQTEIQVAGIEIFLAGSFFSDKAMPNDIEVTIPLNANKLIDPTIKHIIDLGNSQEHERLKKTYRVDFYITIELAGHNDFRQFFQYVGEKTANVKGLNSRDKRGIVKLIL
ncbi:hypothetical protein MGMO_83c00130 [Methyloglobulus morosus KoM1]|uniref:Uncharacterized protein n=1 Tax=Methyloglobulus morosus KoM1 TaxID=1116472 RepID=V5BF67_9GAMM|nr:hypothetical protein [Methyloglobulus morosus]ESS71940.1 hypothetical protein MGMO_83c00130 [Methyloglobulus morosus KoM1]